MTACTRSARFSFIRTRATTAASPLTCRRPLQPVREPTLGTAPHGQSKCSRQKETAMSTADKAKGKAQAAKGKVKKGTGKAVGNPRLEAKGKAEQVKGDLKQAKEKVKDAGKK